MKSIIVSEQELKTRLSNLSNDEFEDLIDQYVGAALENSPDMNVITDLAQKTQASKLLRVRFELDNAQYDALTNYFGEASQPATSLVKKALEEFIQEFAS